MVALVPSARSTTMPVSPPPTMVRNVSFLMAYRAIFATSAAQLCWSPANSPSSKPCGFSNTVSVQPSSAAFAFMEATNASSLPPIVSAMATAASLPDGTSSALSATSSGMASPSCNPADDSPTAAAAAETVTVESSDTAPEATASSATMAVMTFVMEAICVGLVALRSK